MSDVDFAALKAGDAIGYKESGGWYGARTTLTTVARKTATQVILANGKRFNKYGREVGAGDRFHVAPWLVPEKEARESMARELADSKQRALAHELSDHKWKDESTETMLKVKAILKGAA